MKHAIMLIVGSVALGTLAGCVATTNSSVGSSAGTSDEAACLRAVSERAGTSNVTVMSYETSEANSLAMIQDGFGVTWRCLVNDGSVVEISPV